METVIEPRVKIVYAGKDITQDISKYLLSVEYTDNTSDSSDEISFSVEDTDGLWRCPWMPHKGDKVQMYIGYDNDMLNCGTFTVDEIEMSGPPDVVSIRALASSINSPVRTKTSKAYEKQTLQQIAEDIAKKYGYKIVDNTIKTYSTEAVDFGFEREVVKKFFSAFSKISVDATRDKINNIFASSPSYISMAISSLNKKQGSSRAKNASAILIKARDIIAGGFKKLSLSSSQYLNSSEKVFVGQIAQAIIPLIKSALSLMVDTKASTSSSKSKLDDIQIERITQSQETDLSFLKRIADDYGIMFSLRDTDLIFSSIYEIEKTEPIGEIDRKDLISYSVKDKATAVYKEATVKHKSSKSNKVVESNVPTKFMYGGEGGGPDTTSKDTLEVRVKAENKGQAEKKARAKLHKANSKEKEGSFALIGVTTFIAGNNFTLTGMGRLSGVWNILKSTHKIDRSGGYTTDIEAKLIKPGSGKATHATIGEVLFDKNSSVLRPEGYPEIDKVITFMKENIDEVIVVAGHTDSDSGVEYNQALSERRSKAVVDYMVSKGILATRLIAKGYGESSPVASNATPEGMQKNRRTEFVSAKEESC